ncbi:MAG TPA: OprD family porin [Methanosarcina sp.]|nr:OprD family porin [Methanosarcina sp.]
MNLFKNFVFMLLFAAALPCVAAENLQGMFSRGELSAEVRAFYFGRDFDGSTTDREDLAVGGIMSYRTDSLKGVSFGVSFATANDAASDDDKNVYGLLPSDEYGNHDSVTRLQEAFIQGKWFNTQVRYGAQMVNTPFLNNHDIRLLSKSYKGLSVINNTFEHFEFQAYYITDYLDWSSDSFVSMTESVGSSGDRNPMMIGMMKYTFPVDFVKASIEGWQYHMEDTVNMSYFKAIISGKVGDASLRFVPMYFMEKSIGDDYAGEFDTDQYGFNAGVSSYGASVDVFYAKTGDNKLYTPWGDSRVINMQILASEMAEEDAYAVRVGYDFSEVGVKGFNAFITYGVFDSEEFGRTASNDGEEVDFDLQYNLKYVLGGLLDGFSLRARYAIINKDQGEDFTDTRIYLKYKFALGK